MIKRWISWAVKLALTAGSMWYLFHKVDLAAMWQIGKEVSPWMFLWGLLLQVIQVLLYGFRWKLVLKAIGERLSFRQSCEIFSIGNFFGQVLPGAIGGDAVRMWKTHRAGLSLGKSINSVALERIATVFGLVLLVTLSEPLLLKRLGNVDGPHIWLFPALTVASVGGILFLTQLDRLSWKRLPFGEKIADFAKLAEDTRKLWFSPWYGPGVLAVVLIGHINLVQVVWVLVLGTGVHVDMLDCLVLVPPAILIATLPISIGGWGIRETAMITLLGMVGVPAAQATVVSVMFGLLSILVSLPGGAFWLFSRDRRDMAAEARRN